VGRWVGTRTFGATDGVATIDGDAALDVARRKLVELERGPDHQFAPGLALIEPVAAGFVPSMVKLESPTGMAMSFSLAQDSWVFEFGRPGRGAVVIVDADSGTVSDLATT
jgi:hypothetical protein